MKTIGKSVYDFPISYLQFGYYRQCAFYEIALQSIGSPIFHLLEEGYQLLDFIFIVVESKVSSSHPAVIYRTNKYDRECGRTGGNRGQKYYKGVDQLIDDYAFHVKHNYWDLPMDLLKNRGEIGLQIFDYAEEPLVHSSDDEL